MRATFLLGFLQNPGDAHSTALLRGCSEGGEGGLERNFYLLLVLLGLQYLGIARWEAV